MSFMLKGTKSKNKKERKSRLGSSPLQLYQDESDPVQSLRISCARGEAADQCVYLLQEEGGKLEGSEE